MRSCVVAIVVCSLCAVARADDEHVVGDPWTSLVTRRPLALLAGMIEVRGSTLGVSLAADAIGKPVVLAPSVFYGITEAMTVGITHTAAFGTGGICIAGEGNGCTHVYNNVNLEAFHLLLDNERFAIASHPQLAFLSFSPDVLVGFRIATTIRFRTGNLAIVTDPGVLIGFNKRGSGNATELVSVPLQIQLQWNAQLEAHVTTGIAGSLQDPLFLDSYVIPVGVGATYVATHRIDLGADFTLDNVGGVQLGSAGRADARTLTLRVAWRNR